MAREEGFMREAVNAELLRMRNAEGRQFGSVIVKGDHIIGGGCNRVIVDNDPTAHPAIIAIRAA
jgi:guanine deaminase